VRLKLPSVRSLTAIDKVSSQEFIDRPMHIKKNGVLRKLNTIIRSRRAGQCQFLLSLPFRNGFLELMIRRE
jgi:hypothetical protein